MASSIFPFVDVVLAWSRKSAGVTAILRKSRNGWDELQRVESTECVVTGLDPKRAHTFAAAAILADGRLEQDDRWQVIRVSPLTDAGAPARPTAPQGFAVGQDGASLNFTWDAAADGVTKTYELRVGAPGDTWDQMRLAAADLVGGPFSWPWWASGAQQFSLKAIDRFGRASKDAATKSLTVASLETHLDGIVSDEAGGGFTGTKTRMDVDAGNLRLAPLPEFLAGRTEPLSAYTAPAFSRYWNVGTYETGEFNVGALQRHRLEIDLGHALTTSSRPLKYSLHSALGRRRRRDGSPIPLGTPGIAARNTLSQLPLAPMDLEVELDLSDTAGGGWAGWRPFVPGTYEFWRSRFRITARGDGRREFKIPSLVFVTRKLALANDDGEVKLIDDGQVVLPGGGPFPVSFDQPFTESPKITFAIVGNPPGVVRVELQPIDALSFTLEAFDALSVSVPATLYWHAIGV